MRDQRPGYRKNGDLIPRAMLFGAAGLLAFTTLAAGLSRVAGANAVDMAPSPVVATRDLEFTDRPDRGIDIRDAKTRRLVQSVAPKTGGFLRGAMRGLLYNVRYDDSFQHANAAGAAKHVFRLTRWADGRLSLEDCATHRSLELEAFGTTNEQVFSNLLNANLALDMAAGRMKQ